MKQILRFVKATVAGGFFVVLPVVLAWMVVTETVDILAAISAPLTALVLGPDAAESGDTTLLAVALLVFVCFATGLAMRTRSGMAVGRFFERTLLEVIPGYKVLKSFTQTMGGRGSGVAFTPALLTGRSGEELPVLAVEQHRDGRFTVLVPLTPTPTVGSLQVVPGDRVRLLDVPLGRFMECYMNFGSGVESLLEPVASPATEP